MDAKQIESQVDRYVRTYLAREIVQAPSDANIDPQLASIILVIAERLSSQAQGTIIDLGCGQGVLLTRLAELPQFRDQPNWIYLGIDDDDKLDQLARTSRRLGINRRVEPISLTDRAGTGNLDRTIGGVSA